MTNDATNAFNALRGLSDDELINKLDAAMSSSSNAFYILRAERDSRLSLLSMMHSTLIADAVSDPLRFTSLVSLRDARDVARRMDQLDPTIFGRNRKAISRFESSGIATKHPLEVSDILAINGLRMHVRRMGEPIGTDHIANAHIDSNAVHIRGAKIPRDQISAIDLIAGRTKIGEIKLRRRSASCDASDLDAMLRGMLDAE